MRILLATDAWSPQVNGVVRTWQQTIRELEALGHAVEVMHPGLERTIAAPRYNEIRLSLAPWRIVSRAMSRPFDAVHIATEGPIGLETRRRCESRGIPYTTSYHTQFPEYMKRYFALPPAVTWRFMRWFHGGARATLAPTQQVTEQLRAHGIARAQTWCRGVDAAQFRPVANTLLGDLPRPIHLYAGRVAREKNIDAFIDAPLPGSKVVVGDGPERRRLQAMARPNVKLLGRLPQDEVNALMSRCRAYVYAGLEDFGIAPVEAMAAGAPVIGLGQGGLLDSVRCISHGGANPTGLLFPEQSVTSLVAALEHFEQGRLWQEMPAAELRQWAERFGPQPFAARMADVLERSWAAHQQRRAARSVPLG